MFVSSSALFCLILINNVLLEFLRVYIVISLVLFCPNKQRSIGLFVCLIIIILVLSCPNKWRPLDVYVFVLSSALFCLEITFCWTFYVFISSSALFCLVLTNSVLFNLLVLS